MSDHVENYRLKIDIPGGEERRPTDRPILKSAIFRNVKSRGLNPDVEKAVLAYFAKFPSGALDYMKPRLDSVIETISRRLGQKNEEISRKEKSAKFQDLSDPAPDRPIVDLLLQDQTGRSDVCSEIQDAG